MNPAHRPSTISHNLSGVTLRASSPVEIGRGRGPGHFWFPTFHALPGGEVLCLVPTSDDRAQGEWPAAWLASRDGGATWQALPPGWFGASSVAAEQGLLILPYEVWPREPGARRDVSARGTLLRAGDAGGAREPLEVCFGGLPEDLADYLDDERYLLVSGTSVASRDGSHLLTPYGRTVGARGCDLWCFVADAAGRQWRYRSTIARHDDLPNSTEGATEATLVRLADHGLLCVFRVGSGAEYPYHRSVSRDEGLTWSRPEPMRCGAGPMGSVAPRLARLGNGLLVLGGGRPGLDLWVCTDGNGEEWEHWDLAAHHNARVDEASDRLDGDAPEGTTAYVSLLPRGGNGLLAAYDRLGNGWVGAVDASAAADRVYVVRLEFDPR